MAVVWSIEQLVIPPDIILDILSRLPVESVIRCKCVCRSWRSLLQLNSLHFSKLHLHQQQKQKTGTRSNQFDFLIKYKPDVYGVIGQEFEFLEYLNDDDDDNDKDNVVVNEEEHDDEYSKLFGRYQIRKVDHRLKMNYNNCRKYFLPATCRSFDYFIEPLGSCNGIVCLGCDGDPMYLCNPVTSEYTHIPRHREYYYHYSMWSNCGIFPGFGYHPGTDEYKVVRIYYENVIDGRGQVEVYTVGSKDGWRDKGQISHTLYDCQRGVLINGTLYWTSYNSMSEIGILAFDLASEEFYEVAKVPQARCYSYEAPPRIRNLGGCLSLVSTVAADMTEVWVMKNSTTANNEDDDEYSWVKEFSIPQNWEKCDPFTLTKKGEIIALCHHPNMRDIVLVPYDPKTGDSKQYVDESNSMTARLIWYGVVPHLKSFISLKDLGEEGARTVETHKRESKIQMPFKRRRFCKTLNVFSED